jgi:hypothetical protein
MIKISQSLMKTYTDYLNAKRDGKGLCGLYFKAQYIDKVVESKPSAAMKEGIYFEYLCTGALPRNGEIPQAEYTKGGLTTAYQRAKDASEFFKSIITYYGIKILKTGYVVSTGIIDIWAHGGRMHSGECIIDLKYSGLIDDKWNELGWDTESLTMKDSLMIQGVHYKMLIKKALGLDVPFFYFIFNSKDPTDMKIIREEVDEDKFFFHEQAVNNVKNMLMQDIERGFKAFPDYRQCKDCPVFATCPERIEFPTPIKIYY